MADRLSTSLPFYNSMALPANRSAFHAESGAEVNQGNQLTNHNRSSVASNSGRLRENRDFFYLAAGGMATLAVLVTVKVIIETVTGEKSEFLKKVVNYSSIALMLWVGLVYFVIHFVLPILSSHADGYGRLTPDPSTPLQSLSANDSYRAHHNDVGHEVA